ncbi:MAG: YlbF family regulator [Oscillospiraceae bacterium]|nr:YlbF family regulator [Oscillospiraceae bacterium]
MGILEATRALGKEMQKDERFIAFAKAKLANDNDEQLQKDIGEFNIVRMNLEKETGAEQVNEEKVKELNEELRSIYTKIMSSKTMVDYNNAKAGLDAMLNDLHSVIMQCALGADPETCEPEHECSGSCSTCGGCN